MACNLTSLDALNYRAPVCSYTKCLLIHDLLISVLLLLLLLLLDYPAQEILPLDKFAFLKTSIRTTARLPRRNGHAGDAGSTEY